MFNRKLPSTNRYYRIHSSINLSHEQKIVQSADVVYLEAYTSVLEGTIVDPERLQKAYGLDKPIQVKILTSSKN